MDTEIKLLWIEEETDTVLHEFKIHLTNKNYQLKIVYTASEAEDILIDEKFDLIILDIRINAGLKSKWIDLYIDCGNKLGLEILNSIIGKSPELLNRTIVFSNESWGNVAQIFSDVGLSESKFLQKNKATRPIQLEDFIKSHLAI